MVLGNVKIELVQKGIKNLHLSVLPPYGHVRISAPLHLSNETIRLYAISKLPWIKLQQQKIRNQERESPREFTNRETHFFHGRKYLLRIIERDAPAGVIVNSKYLDLYVRPNTSPSSRQRIVEDWYRKEMKTLIPPYIKKWEKIIPVKVREVSIKQMKTHWGTCNIEAKRIWLNLELAKKPLRCLEYILVHEMVHLLERHHNDRFMAYLDKYMPQWKSRKDELNRLPICHPLWTY
ncbi:MAG TPA: SprT family zinc-dependent metalloprotease [Puia sp.]|nr:SprT family zinc-dependent metalloprotease [Puia sp.]